MNAQAIIADFIEINGEEFSEKYIVYINYADPHVGN